MLVLSRKESERIRVGDSIVVTVVRLTKDRVRLGIEAPDDVLVLRDELEKEGDAPFTGSRSRSPARRMPVQTTIAQKLRGVAYEAEPCTVATEEPEVDMEPQEAPMTGVTRKPPERPYFRW